MERRVRATRALPPPLQTLHDLMQEYDQHAYKLQRREKEIMREGQRLIIQEDIGVAVWMYELLRVPEVDLKGQKQRQGPRIVRWFLRLIEEGKFEEMARRRAGDGNVMSGGGGERGGGGGGGGARGGKGGRV